MDRDLPDFHKPTIAWQKSEYSSSIEAIWTWFLKTAFPLPVGNHGPFTLYTIPIGFRAMISDIGPGADFTGRSMFRIPGGDNIYLAYHQRHETRNHSFILPSVAMPGQSIVCEISNFDVAPGDWRAFLTIWKIPGSVPENPKNDTPAERFRVGDFSTVNQFILPNRETLFLFHKRNEDKENYLRIKDYGLKTQKKLAEFHLKPEQCDKMVDALNATPEKTKDILKKFEK